MKSMIDGSKPDVGPRVEFGRNKWTLMRRVMIIRTQTGVEHVFVHRLKLYREEMYRERCRAEI